MTWGWHMTQAATRTSHNQTPWPLPIPWRRNIVDAAVLYTALAQTRVGSSRTQSNRARGATWLVSALSNTRRGNVLPNLQPYACPFQAAAHRVHTGSTHALYHARGGWSLLAVDS